MAQHLILCSACRRAFRIEGEDIRIASHDHSIDEHREQYLADPGSLVFTDIDARAWLLAPALT